MDRRDKKDQRRHKRIPFKEDILIDGNIKVNGIDISDGGLYVYTGSDCSFTPNSLVDVTIPVKDQKLTVKAKIKHIQEGIGMGLMFLNLDDVQKGIIKEFIESMDDENVQLTTEKTTVLLIEDNDMSRRVQKNKLLMEGFFVVEANDGIEAFEFLKSNTPDVIVLDLYMEKMDGFKVLAVLRHSPKWKDIPVIVYSVIGTQDIIDKVLRAGADEFLAKMMTSPAKLAETVKAVSQRKKG